MRFNVVDTLFLVAVLAAVPFLSAGGGYAQDAPADGLFITVHNPITDKEVARVRELTEDAIRRYREATKGEAKPSRFRIISTSSYSSGEQSTTRRLVAFCAMLTSLLPEPLSRIHGRRQQRRRILRGSPPQHRCNQVRSRRGHK